MPDAWNIRAERIEVLHRVTHFVVRPICELIAKSAQRAISAFSCRRQAFDVVARFSDTSLHIRRILCACVAVKGFFEIGKQIDEVGIASINTLQLCIQISEGSW